MLTVACVLKAGPEYTADHVAALQRGVAKHLSAPHRFVCLTDVEVPCEAIPLQHRWPGWWSKIELFASGTFSGPVLYFDLDTIITGPLIDIAQAHRFAMLENFWRTDRVGSGMMAWDCDLSQIYHRFAAGAEKYIREYTTPDKWGDQAFILAHSPVAPSRLQTMHPGMIVSWKRHCVPINGVPASAGVVCFHGQPRPWNTPLWGAA